MSIGRVEWRAPVVEPVEMDAVEDWHRYFSKEEISCNCGCGLMVVDEELMEMMVRARIRAGIAFPVVSWCRCREYNKRVGGTVESAHMDCKAVDIRVSGVGERFVMAEALFWTGFRRFGIGRSFIHVDIDREKMQNVMWTYGGQR